MNRMRMKMRVRMRMNISTFHQLSSLGRVGLVVCVIVHISPFHVLDFEAYFAPTSLSRMSKNFRDLEFFAKSAGNKWSQN